MRIIDGPLEGLKIIELDVHGDARGFFIERYHKERFAQHGFKEEFVQDNHSRSAPGIVRGLHYQHAPAQGKLVGITRGRVWDVAVDIRPNSKTYGRHFGVELAGREGNLFYIPPGFAHGFCVLGDEPADMLYKVTAHYHAAGEGGIRFDDTELNIPWPVKHAILSDRDKALPDFATYKRNPAKW